MVFIGVDMTSWPILSIITFLPLVGAAFILLIRGDEKTVARNAKYLALWTTIITFILSLILWLRFDKSTAEFQIVEKTSWLSENISYHNSSITPTRSPSPSNPKPTSASFSFTHFAIS